MSTNLVSIDSVSKGFPERPVLTDVSFGIDAGDHLGVIGFNGSGKSTLLDLVAGVTQPDGGSVVHRAGLEIAYLAQDPDFGVAETVGDLGDGDHRFTALVDRLGITDTSAAITELSGGQRRRVALARTLADDSQLLILDEPTNHLDIDVIDWLEDELARRSQTVVFVTHDRYLLDRLATRVVEIDDGSVFQHDGGYQSYLEARAARLDQAARAEQTRRNLAKVELEWLRRSPKARTSKSKARIDRATALQSPNAPVDTSPDLDIEVPARRLGDRVVELHDVSVAFGDVTVLQGIDHHLKRGDRLGVVGANGSGKSTLMKTMAGQIEPTTGAVDIGETVSVGWYGQDPQPIDPATRILDVVTSEVAITRSAAGLEIGAGRLLERFGFPSRRHSTLVGELSGGERRRLELLRVLSGAPNLLFLDEPTNDLDLATLGAIEDVLDTWRGVLVVASHDRYFLQRVCTDLVSVEPDGSLMHHPGGYTAYLEHHRARRSAAKPSSGRQAPLDSPSGRRQGLTYNQQRELKSLDRRIPVLETRLAEIDETMASGGAWEELATLGEEREAVAAELDEAETRWLDLSERS